MGYKVLDSIIDQCLQDSTNWFPATKGDVTFLALAMCGEVGEVANEAKKLWRKGGLTDLAGQNTAKLEEEVVDVFIYLMNIVGELDMDLVAAYQKKRDFNAVRFARCAPSIVTVDLPEGANEY